MLASRGHCVGEAALLFSIKIEVSNDAICVISEPVMKQLFLPLLMRAYRSPQPDIGRKFLFHCFSERLSDPYLRNSFN